MAAVNDITSRDEQLQHYLSQNALKESVVQSKSLANNAAAYDQTNYLLNDLHDTGMHPKELIVQTLDTDTHNSSGQHHTHHQHHHHNHNHRQTSHHQLQYPTNQLESNHQQHLHQITQQQTQPQQKQQSNDYQNNLKLTNLQSANSEYVDINDMDFIEHRSRGNYIEELDTSQENLLVRRSQRKLKKEDDRKLFYLIITILCHENIYIYFFAVMITDKHVPCRAWASLPTTYLYIGKSAQDINGKTIFIK